MSTRAASPDMRGRRLVAPVGLIIAVALIAGTAWWLAAGLRVQTVAIPVAVDESGTGVIPQPGPQALAIIQADSLSADVVRTSTTRRIATSFAASFSQMKHGSFKRGCFCKRSASDRLGCRNLFLFFGSAGAVC